MNNDLRKELRGFIVLYFTLVLANHILPDILRYFIFAIVLVVFFFSKTNYYWLALFTIMLNFAGGFFSYFTKFPTVFTVPFDVVLSLTMILKVLYQGGFRKVFYVVPYSLLLILLIILRVFTGFDIMSILKSNVHFLLLLIIPSLIQKPKEFESYLYLIYLGVIIVLIGQWFHIFTGHSISGFFFGAGTDQYFKMISRSTEGLVRSVEGIGISFIGLFGSLVLISLKPEKQIHYIMLMLSFISIWITATRGWILASLFMMLPIMLRLKTKQIVNSFGVIIVLVLLIWQVEYLNRQVFLSFERLETIEYIVQGDVTAGGTLVRLTDRHEPVWNKFKESPIFGFGFSKEYSEFSDGHVGNQNLLLNVGIVGYSMFLALIFSLILAMYSLRNVSPELRKSSSVLIFTIIGIFIIHSTSRQMFSFGGGFSGQFIIAYVYALANSLFYNYNEYLNPLRTYK